MKSNTFKNLPWLFGIHFFIRAFTFGGGYVVIPMIRRYFVEKKQLFSEEELLEMAAIAQSSPGAIAVNLSVLSGYRTLGRLGAAVSCIASVLPPLLLISMISIGYDAFSSSRVVSAILKGMEAGVAALIVDMTIDMCRTIFRERRLILTLLVPATFLASSVFHINVCLLIPGSALLCLAECKIREQVRRRVS